MPLSVWNERVQNNMTCPDCPKRPNSRLELARTPTPPYVFRMLVHRSFYLIAALLTIIGSIHETVAADSEKIPSALINGTGPGWTDLTEKDFVNVNCAPDTWSWKDGIAHCTGRPTGILRAKNLYTNFELVVQWRHLRSAGNSGVFVWGTEESVNALKPGQLPQGIEVQVLDHGYAEQYEKRQKKKSDWFTTHGDVFPTGASKMTPFPPVAPNGKRSFPSKNLSKGVGEWNHYYVRCINGEVRLWVNGEEVSGGTGCEPRTGVLALESEGSPVEFKNIRIRVLP